MMTLEEFVAGCVVKPTGRDCRVTTPNGKRFLCAGTRSKVKAMDVNQLLIEDAYCRSVGVGHARSDCPTLLSPAADFHLLPPKAKRAKFAPDNVTT
jgi:hypothetical protein